MRHAIECRVYAEDPEPVLPSLAHHIVACPVGSRHQRRCWLRRDDVPIFYDR